MSDCGGDCGGGGCSDGGGTDNLAFSIGDDCVSSHVTSSAHDVGHSNEHVTLEHNYKSPCDTIDAPKENGGHHRSFVSQHYVEPVRNSPEPCYKSETKIDLPSGQTPDKNCTTEHKLNGVHGNGNNNDASFLNSSATSVQVNDNGKKEQIEAVNLELVSMRPYTGNNIQTKGQEACEVPADPYEEYFVPVNEHRKYIRGPEAEVETTVAGVRFDLGPGVGREGLSLRDPAAGLVDYSHWLTALRGEKLYVTKDKRSRSSYWRRMLCWGCGLSILAIVIIIAILAATGVILTTEASEPLNTLDETNSQFDGAQTAGSQEYVKDPPLSPPPQTSTFPPWQTTDETLYQTVPDALDGVLKLDNLVWNEEMADVKSRVHRDVAFEIEQYLDNLLRTNTKDQIVIKVYDITKDSEVKFRISHPTSSTPEEMQENIEKAVRDNSNMIGRYHLSRLQVGKLVDECQHGNLSCAETCKFDYSQGSFICSCAPGKTLHRNGQDCVDENDLSNVEMDDTVPTSSSEGSKDIVQGRSRGPGMLFEPGHPDGWDHSDFVTNSMRTPSSSIDSKLDIEPTAQSVDQTGEEPNKNVNNDTEISHEHITKPYDWVFSVLGHPTDKKHSVEGTAEPEPSAEPASPGEPRSSGEEESSIKSETKSSIEAEAPVESEPMASAEPIPSSEPESSVEPELNPADLPEPSAEPESPIEPELNPTVLPEPSAEPEPSTEPEPPIEPELNPVALPESTSEAEPSVEPDKSMESEPSIEPQPTVEPESPPDEEPYVEPELNPVATEQPESTAKPESSVEPDKSVESEPSVEPQPVTEPQPSAEPQPSIEPELNPVAAEQPEPPAEPESSVEPDKSVESGPSEDQQLTIKPEPALEFEPSMRPEPTAEPKPSTEPESSTNPESEIDGEVLIKTLPESTMKPEPSAEPEEKLPIMLNHSIEEDSSTKLETSSENSIEEKSTESNEMINVTQSSIESDLPMVTTIPQERSQSSSEIEHSTMPEILMETTPESVPNISMDTTLKPESSLDSESRSLHNNIDVSTDETNNDEPQPVIPLTMNDEKQTTEVENEQPTTISSERGIEKDEPSVTTESVTTQPVTMIAIDGVKESDETTLSIKHSEDALTEKENEITELPVNDDIEVPHTTLSSIHSEETTLNVGVEPMMTLKTDSETTFPELFNVETSSEMAKPVLETTTESIEISMTNIKPEEIEHTSNLTDNSEESLSSKNYTIEALDTPELNVQDINESNVIEHAPKSIFLSLPKEFGQNVEPLIESISNETSEEHIMPIPSENELKHEQDTHAIIPQLIPEQITHFTAKPEESTTHREIAVELNDQSEMKKNMTVGTVILDRTTEHPDENAVSIGETLEHSTNHPLHPAIFPENTVNHFVEKTDHHVEDMSPFLPDVHKEKETSKKAPRLDKDEQDIPNPFEPHVEDVIVNQPEQKDIKVEHPMNPNESEEMSNDFDNYNMTMKVDTKDDVSIIAKEVNETGIELGDSVQQNELLRESEGEESTQSSNSTQMFATNDLSDGIAINATSDINNEKVTTDEEIFSVVPLDAQKETKATEYEMSDKVETTTEAAHITTMAFIEQKDKSLEESMTENSSSSEKQDENAVEDQYNDINDDTLPKTFDPTNSVKIVKEIQKDEQSIVANPETQQDKIKSISSLEEVQSTTEKMPSTETEMPSSSFTSVSSDKNMEDAKLTTQVPVLPIEIERELSTTEPADKLEQTTIANLVSDNHTENSGPASSDVEKESITIIPSTMTPMYSLETKTTAQVPIMPEEWQTTEHELSVTTSSMRPEIMKEVNDVDVSNETRQDEIIPTTVAIEKISNISMITVSSMISSEITNVDNATSSTTETTDTNLTETISNESNNTMDSIPNTVLNEESNETSITTTVESITNYPKVETTFAMSNEDYTAMATEMNVAKESDSVTISEDIRPVTEEVLDDTRPFNFGFRSLFPVTTPRDTIVSVDSGELSEEELRVIPLEKSQEIKKKPTEKKSPDKFKYKKEKELSLENQKMDIPLTENYELTTLSTTETSKGLIESNENVTMDNINISNTSTDSTVSEFILTDTEGNIVPVPKLKITEITAPLNEFQTNASMANATANNTENVGPKKYPNYIPVSEEIIESPPVTEPFVLLRNFSLHRTIPSIAFGVEQATTPSNILMEPNDTISNPSEMILQTSVKEMKNLTVDHFGPLPSAIMGYSKCSTGQFQCTNGTSRDGAYCVSLSSKCDSEKDCSDGSDELNCEAEGCPGNFQCANRQCLKRHLVCNGIVDCDDGSDEKDCQNWQCIFDEYRCSSGRCIPTLWRCNDRSDCEDHRDEHNCAESCGNDKYLCSTEKRCIPQTWRCNGIPECFNGEDEALCDCSVNQFRCNTGGCVSQEEVCDGIPHCPDHSDEWDCLSSFFFVERNNTEPDEKENEESGLINELSDRVSLLKIRQSDGDYRLICSDGWSKEFSDSYCRSLGFASSETTDFKAWDRNHKILRLKSNPNHRAPLVTNLQQVEFCVSEKVIEVSCQEFSSHCAGGPTARLAGGTPVSVEQWPSVALLKENDHGVACTASVLGPLHALASYSCVHKYSQSGEWKLLTGGNMFKANPVKTITPYPQAKYNQFFYNNDIALVELEEPLIFSRNVSATCLPTHPIQPRQICVTAGWRFPVNGEVDLQKYLEFLPVPTYDSEKCNATGHYAGFITKDDICVNFTDTDKGPCYNDEGAPLMCVSESGKWEIQGLLSHHSRCSRRHPAIYSSLEPALFWLRHSVPALQVQS